MASRAKIAIRLTGLILGLGMVLSAQLSQAQVLSLEDCLKTAFDQSLSLREAQQDVEVAREKLRQALSDFGFTIRTTYGYTWLDSVTYKTSGLVKYQASSRDNYQWNVTLNQPLFTGFSLLTAKRLRELGLDVSQISLELAKLDLAVQVKEGYFSLLLAQKSQLVAEQAVKQLEAQVVTAQNFYEVGITPKNDLLQVQVELANSRQQLILAVNTVRLAKANLNTILRRDVEADIHIQDISEAPPVQFEFGESMEKALSQRPEVQQAEKQVTILDESIRLAQAEYWPQVAFSADYTRGGDSPNVSGYGFADDEDPDEATISVGLTWLLWNWEKTKHTVAEQRALQIKARHTLNRIKDQISLEVKGDLLNLAAAGDNIEVSRLAIEQAEENYRMSEERFKEQVTTSTEVLDAQTRLSQAQRNYYAALYDYHLAQAQLKRARGEM